MLAYSAPVACPAGSLFADFSHMPSPLIVVVVVALADSGNDATRAMTRTVQEALADTALVLVHEEAHPEDDAVLTNLGTTMHANAVVVVHWSDRGRADVRVYRAELHTWTSRDVTFGADDPAEERGRSLGFGIASMVRAGTPEVPEKQAPPPTPPPAPAPPPAAAPPLPRWDVELAGQAAVSSASTTSWGGSIGAGFRMIDRLVLRAAFAGRAGAVDEATASSLYLRVTGGASWAAAFHRFTIGPRVEIGGIRQEVSRSDGSGAQWSGLIDLRAEGTASPIPRLAIVVGIGTELVLQRVPIRVDTVQVTTLAPVRALGSVGVRFFLD